MKILYISPARVKKDFFTGNEEVKEIDFDALSASISQGISQSHNDVEITLLKDIVDERAYVSKEMLSGFDFYICDLTTSNGNVTYFAGLVEGMGKPLLYLVSNESTRPDCFSHKRILVYSDTSLDNDFKRELNNLIGLAKENPLSFSDVTEQENIKPKAFISYSHQNKSYLERLMVHLKPLTKNGLLDIWVDTRIKTGDKWKEEIENALTESSISILLISADFMASDFIVNNELPPLLSKAEVKGTKILPVIVSPCRFSREPTLNRFQAINSPTEPLSAMSEDEREMIYDKLAHEIEQSLANA